MRRLTFLPLLLSWGLTACLVGPKYKRPVTAPPEIYYTDPNGKKPPVLSGQRRWRVLRPPTTDPTDYPATPWDGQVVIPP